MIDLVIGVVVLVWLVARQLSARRVTQESSVRLVVILAAVGIAQTASAARGAHTIPAPAVALLAASMLLGAALGAWRAATVRLWVDSAGVAWRQGTMWTAGLWLIALAVHVAADALVEHGTHAPHGLAGATILIYLAVSLGCNARSRAHAPPGLAAGTSPVFAHRYPDA